MFIANYQERGMEKEKKFRTGIMQKQQEEERARVPKANPYPHTTNYRVVRRFIIAFYVIYFANVKRHALLITSLFSICRFHQNQSPNNAHNQNLSN